IDDKKIEFHDYFKSIINQGYFLDNFNTHREINQFINELFIVIKIFGKDIYKEIELIDLILLSQIKVLHSDLYSDLVYDYNIKEEIAGLFESEYLVSGHYKEKEGIDNLFKIKPYLKNYYKILRNNNNYYLINLTSGTNRRFYNFRVYKYYKNKKIEGYDFTIEEEKHDFDKITNGIIDLSEYKLNYKIIKYLSLAPDKLLENYINIFSKIHDIKEFDTYNDVLMQFVFKLKSNTNMKSILDDVLFKHIYNSFNKLAVFIDKNSNSMISSFDKLLDKMMIDFENYKFLIGLFSWRVDRNMIPYGVDEGFYKRIKQLHLSRVSSNLSKIFIPITEKFFEFNCNKQISDMSYITNKNFIDDMEKVINAIYHNTIELNKYELETVVNKGYSDYIINICNNIIERENIPTDNIEFTFDSSKNRMYSYRINYLVFEKFDLSIIKDNLYSKHVFKKVINSFIKDFQLNCRIDGGAKQPMRVSEIIYYLE
ncbi:MAG: hypothetical protein V3575_05290, partial [Candidatus Absconditabacteria bacterium]